MTGNVDRVEVITSVQRRRRWSAEDKARIVQETPAFARAGSTRRGCRCRWSRASTGSRRTRCSNGVSSTPRARCLRSGPAKRWWRRPNTGLCSTRCVNCNGYWARRRSRTRSCAKRWTWPSQKNGCCGRPHSLGTTCREDDCRDRRGGTIEPCRPSSSVHATAAPGPATPAGDELLAEIKGTIAGQPTPASARAGSTAIGAFILCFGDSAANRVPRRSM